MKNEKDTEEELYECGVCERKVAVAEGVICGDCFSGGARAMVSW